MSVVLNGISSHFIVLLLLLHVVKLGSAVIDGVQPMTNSCKIVKQVAMLNFAIIVFQLQLVQYSFI